MFNGFPSTVTPSVQLWDFSNAQSSQLSNPNAQIALTDDCAPTQLFYVGGAYYPVRVLLPAASALGKIINIRVELVGSVVNSGNNGVWVYDPLAHPNSDSEGLVVAKIGTPGYLSFVCVAYSVKGASTRSNYKWAVISGSTSSSNALGTYSGASSAQFGYNIVYGITSFAAGSGNTVSGINNAAFGQGHTVSSLYTGAFGGNSNEVNASNAIAIGGYYGTTNGVAFKTVFPGDSLGTFGGRGLSQAGLLSLAVQTTDATATALRSNSSAASTTNQLVLQNNSAMYVSGSIIANVTAAGNTAAWSFEAVIKRGANAAATSIVQSVVNVVAQDTGASGWVVAITADTTNGALRVTVTGQAATTIRWVANLRSTEAGF
tara:strand:- start:4555 stop:5679 length:1125 start_codon:yes stop_codon:yes gene_type:complete